VGEGYDATALWRWLDELTAELTADDRRAVRDAVAEHVGAGGQPTRTELANLAAYACGQMSMAHYLTLAGHERRRGAPEKHP
jgi:hypothetical protein